MALPAQKTSLSLMVRKLLTPVPVLSNANNAIPTQFVQEVQVKSSGFEADFGGVTGGVTNVVTKGGGVKEAKRMNCLGFSIQREDHTEDEKYWMRGTRHLNKLKVMPTAGSARLWLSRIIKSGCERRHGSKCERKLLWIDCL
ncbi:MAG TPA: hypothetical protein VF644_02305 [Pyrinomonadaceae bacterium]